MKYTKADLERMMKVQLANLNTLNEYIRLIVEQNELLTEHNHKLCQELSERNNEPKTSHVQKKRKKFES